MGHWSSLASDKKGVSNVVAVVLLVGLTLTGVVVILATGWVSINETNQQADMEIAEESMLQIDSTLEQSSGGNTTIDLPNELEGKVAISNDQTYELTLNNNSECSTGERPLSSIKYDDNGQAVAYEGGGVWRMTESGATMVSQPDVTYDSGSLDVSFVKVNGQIGSTAELQTSVNTTRERQHQYNLTRALYTDGTYDAPPADGNLDYICRPRNVENATLQIKNSQYSRAWSAWAQNNYDSDLVTVTPTENVEPGDTVTIRYSLGDTSEAEFEVSDVTASRASGSDPIQVTANVTNTGGLRAEKSVQFDYGDQHNETTTSIGGGDSKDVTFTIPADNAVVGPSGESMVWTTATDSANETLTLQSATAEPASELNRSDVPSTLSVGGSPGDANLTVTNTDGMTAFETVTMTVDGQPVASWAVTVPPGETKEIPVGEELPTGNVGTHTLTFSSAVTPGETASVDPFIVGESGYFRLTSVSPPYDVDRGTTVNVSTEVTNSGAEPLRGDVSVTILDNDDGTTVAETTETATLDGTASGAESTTVSTEYTANSVGNYSYRFETPNETRRGLFYVGTPDGPNFVLSGLRFSENPVISGNETTVSVTVNNTGNEADTQTVELTNESGDVIRSETHTLDPDASTSIDWTLDTGSEDVTLGNNELSVSTENTSLQQVLDVREDVPTISDSNGQVEVNVRSDVRITMEGAELEGRYFSGEYPSPTEMTLVINNSSGVYERTLWEDIEITDSDGTVHETGPDVNHPAAERAMQDDSYSNVFNISLSVEANTTVGLYASSYGCGVSSFDESFDTWDYDYTGIEHPDRRDDGSSTYGYVCEDSEVTDDPIIQISNDTNPDNVVIRGDGEEVPAYLQSAPYQLTLSDMLEGRIDDGRLQLADDERVFLYELSMEDASTENADEEGDPDYNDAIARFQVESINRTAETEPNFIITDYDVPSRVDTGDPATLELTVANIGGQEAATDVSTTFAGETYPNTTVPLDTGETDTIEIPLETESLPAGTYEWQTNVTETDGSERSGFLTIGEPSTSFFQISGVSSPPVADDDETPVAAINVTNTGELDGTQQVTLSYENTDDGTTGQVDTTLQIDSGETKDTTLSLPTTPGNYTYTVGTDNVSTSSLDFFLGSSNVYVPDNDSINIGTGDYDTGTVIKRTGGASVMSVELANDGTVGDERDVRLTVTDSDGSEVFRETVTGKQVGGGSLVGQGTVPAYVDFKTDLDPGYYTYTVTVYDDTTADSIADRDTGDLYLRDVSEGGTDADDSPISVGSGTITVN
ncbi:DUF7289 family protein [Haloarcula sediminis]|uniref:DUF7289 family protein n=1 Tax=Haloarcula sediminis TaxID=3111777 RepID=UPI002D76DA58|nr:hypothetical protein [Haloarcula sp. CK38]